MAEEQKSAPADIAELKKELADIKNEMMRKELEAIKREKMRAELEEMKAEQAAKRQPQHAPYVPRLSILTVVMAIVTLFAAGYIIGTLYQFGLTAEVDKYLAVYSLPIGAPVLLTIVSLVLLIIGFGLVTMAKK